MYLFWFDAVSFHITILARVPGFDNKPTCVRRSITEIRKLNNHGALVCSSRYAHNYFVFPIQTPAFAGNLDQRLLMQRRFL